MLVTVFHPGRLAVKVERMLILVRFARKIQNVSISIFKAVLSNSGIKMAHCLL
jgi:hypothetical protein